MNNRREELQRLTKNELFPIMNELDNFRFLWMNKEELIEGVLNIECFIQIKELREELLSMNFFQFNLFFNRNHFFNKNLFFNRSCFSKMEEKEELIDEILDLKIDEINNNNKIQRLTKYELYTIAKKLNSGETYILMNEMNKEELIDEILYLEIEYEDEGFC